MIVFGYLGNLAHVFYFLMNGSRCKPRFSISQTNHSAHLRSSRNLHSCAMTFRELHATNPKAPRSKKFQAIAMGARWCLSAIYRR